MEHSWTTKPLEIPLKVRKTRVDGVETKTVTKTSVQPASRVLNKMTAAESKRG